MQDYLDYRLCRRNCFRISSQEKGSYHVALLFIMAYYLVTFTV